MAATIHVFMFEPHDLDVKAGTTVTWTNQDAILHTVTSGVPDTPSGVFDHTLDGKGTTFSFTFSTPGTYAYFCDRHPSVMRGTVTVT